LGEITGSDLNAEMELFTIGRNSNMGEIIISIVIGGCLVVSGIAMNVILHREAANEEKRRKK